MKSSLLLCCLLTAPLAGCASHYMLAAPLTLAGSGVVDDPQQVSELERSMTDPDIARLLDADIRARLPATMAIARLDGGHAYTHGGGCYAQTTYETVPVSGEELESWQKLLEGQDQILGVQPVTWLVTGKSPANLRELRTAAARMNCELLFIYLQSDTSVDNFNDAAALYWTVVGLWLVPGNVYEHRTLMQAMVVDCRTGAILGTATGDCRLKRLSPAAFGDVQRDKLAAEAPERALGDLQKSCKLLFRNLAVSARKRGA